MARHAFGPDDKLARRKEILAAANALFLAASDGLPGVAEIAARAGLAKGTVYLYFRTKEEIFSTLLSAGIGELLERVTSSLEMSKADHDRAVAAFLFEYVQFLVERPEILILDAMNYSVLESNLSAAALLDFKQSIIGHLGRAGATIDSVFVLEAGKGQSLVMRSFALTRGLWQYSRPSVARDPCEKGHVMHQDFSIELTDALTQYWRGALAKDPVTID